MALAEDLIKPLCVFTVLIYSHLVLAGSATRLKRSSEWKVTTIIDPPYTTTKVPEPKTNNDFEGYIPDLMKKLGDRLSQAYVISIVKDGKYGAKEGSTWNGMIGEVYRGEADVAAGAITVSELRKEVVDFTEPLMDFEAVILMKKPADGSSNKIKSAKNLVDQTVIKYGVVKDGSTQQLIHNSSDPTFRLMSANMMNSDQSNMVANSREGVDKIRTSNGTYAFITESATGDYWVNRSPCNLISVPLSLPKRQYALVVAKGSPKKNQLNEAIQELRATKELEKLQQKWWEGQCSDGVDVRSTISGSVVALLLLVLTVVPN